MTLLTTAMTASEGTASGLEIALTVGGFVLFFVLLISLQLWSRRRRARGEEASTSNSEGAEVSINAFY